MEKARGRIEPPDLSERGGIKDGQPQRSDERLFMQLLAFGGCANPGAVSGAFRDAAVEGAVYADVNDPRAIAVLSMTRTPDEFVSRVRPALNSSACAGLVL